ncbi:MAG: hypothetical protein MUE39_02085 [Gammaproteobacteria bacterium]|nr:hypothetical protein [Gammaproteobacteria bacterium]
MTLAAAPDKFRERGSRIVSTIQSLGLRVPKRNPPAADYPLADTRRAEAWFGALPQANIGELARQTYTGLTEFNRVELPDSVRIAIAERFVPTVEYLGVNLERHFLDTAFPLAAKAEKVASLVRELNAELAISYKIVVERILGGIHEADDQRLLTIALQRALRYIGRTQFRAVLVYNPWPAGSWREAHAIHGFAVQQRLDAVPVRDRLDDGRSPVSTVAETYRQMIVLAAAEPQRLRQREMQRVLESSARWGKALTFVPAEDAEIQPTHRLIDTIGDEEPLLAERFAEPVRGRYLLVDLAPLTSEIATELAGTEAAAAAAQPTTLLATTLLRRLADQWSKPPRRRFSRTRLVFELRVIVGLAAIHAELKESKPAAARAGGPPPSLLHERDLYALAPLGLGLTVSDPEVLGPATQGIAWKSPEDTPPAATGPTTPTFNVRTTNESAGGYCIDWHASNAPRIRVGEVLGIQTVTEDPQFSVGLIRWIQYVGRDTLRVGIELVAPQCEAVDSYVGDVQASRDRHKLKTEPALLLPEFPAAGRPATLLLPTINRKKDDVLWLLSPDADQLVRLGDVVEATGICARFAFEVLQESAHVRRRKATTAGEAGQPSQEFDNLWSNL